MIPPKGYLLALMEVVLRLETWHDLVPSDTKRITLTMEPNQATLTVTTIEREGGAWCDVDRSWTSMLP